MAKRQKRIPKARTKVQEFVAIAFAEHQEQAREYEALLKNNDIPVAIREQTGPSSESVGFAVMVAEDFVDEAYVVIESQDAYDDFYDSALDDEDSDVDVDILDEDF